MYKFRRYDDVRLVFAPEFDAAFFGGDPDNFNFPRYDLDCAFLRLYEGGRPAPTPDFLRWSTTPPAPDEPVFVSGSPGATERQLTIAQLETMRDVTLPLLELQHSELRGRLVQLGEQSPEMARIAADALFDDENTFKIYLGREAALHDPQFLAARAQGRGRPEGQARGQPAAGGPDRRSLGRDRGGPARLRPAIRRLAAAGARRRAAARTSTATPAIWCARRPSG